MWMKDKDSDLFGYCSWLIQTRQNLKLACNLCRVYDFVLMIMSRQTRFVSVFLVVVYTEDKRWNLDVKKKSGHVHVRMSLLRSCQNGRSSLIIFKKQIQI